MSNSQFLITTTHKIRRQVTDAAYRCTFPTFPTCTIDYDTYRTALHYGNFATVEVIADGTEHVGDSTLVIRPESTDDDYGAIANRVVTMMMTPH